MNEEDIKETDLKDLRKGLSSSGKFRSAMLTGPQNGKVSECVIELGNFMLQESPESFWINIDSAKSKPPTIGALNLREICVRIKVYR